MTSKNLCCKLMIEDIKRRVWAVALLMLTFFFSLVVPVIYTGSQPVREYEDYAAWLKDVTQNVLYVVGGNQGFTVFIVIVAAIVCGVSGFSYLHKAKQVDFYHSIPVKREQLFLANYFNGIFMMAVIYLLNLLIAMIAASTFGVGFSVTFSSAMEGYFFHMAFYSLIYTTVVLAMMLTGNVIVALLGTMVFFFYGPGVTVLISGYMSTWLQTFSYTDGVNKIMESLLKYTSPFIYYMVKLDTFGEESVAAVVVAVLLVTFVLAVGICLLYRLRPSESAGRAMAFKKTMAPIKILLVLPLSMAFCIFFYLLRDSFGWAMFGVVCGSLIVHCLMEIIYHFDFRKLFSHKVHLVICLVAGLLILCGFRFDLFGYDSYLPKESQVKTAAVYMRSLDNWVSYGSVEKLPGDTGSYRWRYKNAETYVSENMKLENAADVIAMAEQGILSNKRQENGSFLTDDTYTEYLGYQVEYHLKNGRTVSRVYSAPVSEIEASLKRIYDSEEYKKGVYPILAQTGEETVRVNFQQYNDIMGTVEGAGAAELLAAYQEELTALTYDTRMKELPIGTIQFVTDQMDLALSARMDDSSNGYYYARDIADRSYYPVYPSFAKTLGLLKENGVKLSEGLTGANIRKVELTYYSNDYRGETEQVYELTIEDEKELELLAPALIFDDYYYMNETRWWKRVEQRDYMVTLSNGETIRCYLDQDKTPEFLHERIEEMRKKQAENGDHGIVEEVEAQEAW